MQVKDAYGLALGVVNTAYANRHADSVKLSAARAYNFVKLAMFITQHKTLIRASSRPDVEDLLSAHLSRTLRSLGPATNGPGDLVATAPESSAPATATPPTEMATPPQASLDDDQVTPSIKNEVMATPPQASLSDDQVTPSAKNEVISPSTTGSISNSGATDGNDPFSGWSPPSGGNTASLPLHRVPKNVNLRAWVDPVDDSPTPSPRHASSHANREHLSVDEPALGGSHEDEA